MSGDYITRVFEVLQSNPTAADLDFLVEAFTRIGYYAAEAEGQANDAEARRKHEEANAYLDAKNSGEKVTERQAEAMATVAIWDYRQREVSATTKARKLRNLLDSVEQAINAVKHLDRQTGVPSPDVRLPK